MVERRRATNGYTYEKTPDGKWVRIGGAEGYSPSEQYDAANQGAFRGDGSIDSYIDTIMNASGMTDVQGSSKGNSGTGSGGSGKSTEASDSDPTGEGDGDQDDNGNWIVPAAVAAGGATAIAAWLASRGKKPKGGPSAPAIDDAGEADKGGTGTPEVASPETGRNIVNTRNAGDDLAGLPSPDNIIEGIYSELGMPPAIEGPRNALPSPDVVTDAVNGSAAPMGTQGGARNPDLDPKMIEQEVIDLPAFNDIRAANERFKNQPVDQSIAATGADVALDPETEAALQAYAQQLKEQMATDPTVMDKLTNQELPGQPAMDPYVMQRLRAILQGM